MKYDTSWKILVLSAGDNTGINYCRSLRLAGGKYSIIATDTSIYRLHHASGDLRYLLPPADDPDYFAALRRIIDKEQPDLLYASDTNAELELVTRRRDDLGCRTFWPPQSAMEVYEDKWRTYEECAAAGISVPWTVLIREPDDLASAMKRCGRLWLRATRGSGGRGAIVTDDLALAVAWVKRFNGWGTFTAAEVLTSEMATWTGIWWHGELIAAQGRKRLHWEYTHLSPTGVTGITGAQSTLNDHAVRETAIAAIRAVGPTPHGIVAVDLTYDHCGTPCPTEIQAARFYSSIHFLAHAGLNLPDVFTELGITEKLPALESRPRELADGLVWLKAVDCLPQMTTVEELNRSGQEWRSY